MKKRSPHSSIKRLKEIKIRGLLKKKSKNYMNFFKKSWKKLKQKLIKQTNKKYLRKSVVPWKNIEIDWIRTLYLENRNMKITTAHLTVEIASLRQTKRPIKSRIATENQFVLHTQVYPNPTDTRTLIPFLHSLSKVRSTVNLYCHRRRIW